LTRGVGERRAFSALCALVFTPISKLANNITVLDLSTLAKLCRLFSFFASLTTPDFMLKRQSHSDQFKTISF